MEITESRIVRNFFKRGCHMLATAILLFVTGSNGTALAQQGVSIQPNYKDADVRQIIEAVAEITGKNFIIDPRVNAKVTLITNTPMDASGFYSTFLSALQVHGYVAIESGDIVKIVPDANARQFPTGGSPVNNASDELLTQVVQVNNVIAAQLVPILRPLIPQYGHLAAHPSSNMLIISDRAANVARILRIIRRIDQSSDDDIEVIPLQHASAAETVRIITSLRQGAGRSDGQGAGINMAADGRTNSVLLGGDKNNRLRLRTLIVNLDTPLEDGGNTRVRYLYYADAVELSGKLQEQINQGAAGQGNQPAAGRRENVTIWADEQTNALVMTAPPKEMRQLMNIVDKIDIRRAQVRVEAIIVEITADKVTDLGVSWIITPNEGGGNVAAVSEFSGPGFGVAQALRGFDPGANGGDGDDDGPLSNVPQGLTMAVGRVRAGRTSFAAILSALSGDANTNVLSTPSIVTMDNEEAEIKVAQEVPFLTGQFTNTGAAGGAVNPFQTIQRQEVGTILKITPQINEGDSVLLKIEQEQSSISQGAEGAVDLITNKRTIQTNVIVEDGGIIVLGGLIEDTLIELEQKIPLLGDIPWLGNLFRTRNTTTVKTNLMVFIRPKILRDGVQSAMETNSKYNYMRDLQLQGIGEEGGVQLYPNERRPVLPPLDNTGTKIPGPAVIDARLEALENAGKDGN